MKHRPILFTGIAAIILMLISMPTVSSAVQLDNNLGYKLPTIIQENGADRILFPDGLISGSPGYPSLPTDGVWLLLPPGERAVSIELKNEVWAKIPGTYSFEPIPRPRRLSDTSPYEETPPDPAIYGIDEFYPADAVSNLVTHLKRGFAVATCEVSPFRWNPVNGSLEYLAQAVLNIETAAGEAEQISYNRFYRGDSETRDWVADKVGNDHLLAQYPRRDDDELETVLIVTVELMFRAAEAYQDWWNTRGFETFIFNVEDLIEEENGRDDQEKIRNGIIRAYEELNVGAVILMGDTELVPHRGLYGIVNDAPDYDIPADLYYSGLDGNWNEDNNNRWGERSREWDLLSEVIVGRIPGAMNSELERLTNKVMLYSDRPVVDDILKALMLGENLGWYVWGSDYMNEIYAGTNQWGHVTAGFPDRFNRHNLYDRDREWSANQLRSLISEGSHMIHHLGHAFTNACMKLNVNTVTNNNITNDGEEHGFNIAYSQGCYAGAFDNRGTHPDRYFGYDCIAEKHVSGIDNGFVAFLCNSRFGWGNGYNTNGASQHFEREFVDAIFDEEIYVIGKANEDSKEDLVAWIQDASVMRFVYYEMNLLGDPMMDMWTDEPGEFDPDDDGVIVMGSGEYEVTIEDSDGETVEEARVCLSKDGEILAVCLTDDEGVASLEFDEPINDIGDITLAVTKHNMITYYGEIQTIQPDGGYPWIVELVIEDSDGNDNGMIDAGETFIINPYVRNFGRETLEGLTITIQTDDPMVRLLNETATYSDIDSASNMFADEAFELSIVSHCRDLHEIEVSFLIQNEADDVWSQEMELTVHAPVLSGQLLEVYDGDGNGNGIIDPGEEVNLLLRLDNIGTGDAEDLVAELVCESEMVEIIENEAVLYSLKSGESSGFRNYFAIRVSDDCPDPYRIVFYIRISGAMNFYRIWLKDMGIGGEMYTFERNDDEWEHYNLGDDWGDMWHLSDFDNHTPNGSRCIKLGQIDNEDDYEDNVNCAIEMPEFLVGSSVQLVFWHRIHAECYADDVPDSAFDGGFVEIAVGDGQWELIEPETTNRPGYPYIIRQGQTENPIDEMPCYSGEHDWEPAVFDLSDFEDEDVTIRFRFGSDGSINRGGWWIDDIELRFATENEEPLDLNGEIRGGGAYLSWTTPNLTRDDLVYPNELLGYQIWRETEMEDLDILDTLVRDNQYFDNLIGMERGEYKYRVNALYTTGPSYLSDYIELFWSASVEDDDDLLPAEWSITGSYPNPFNSLAMITYTVPKQGDIRLSVYDLSGRMVVELARGARQPGTYQAIFDGADLASGLYLIRLQTPVGAKVARMVLIR